MTGERRNVTNTSKFRVDTYNVGSRQDKVGKTYKEEQHLMHGTTLLTYLVHVSWKLKVQQSPDTEARKLRQAHF